MPYKAKTVEELVGLMKSIQQKSGLSQQQFAEALDLDPTYLSHVYSGRRSPTTDTVKRLGLEEVRTYVVADAEAHQRALVHFSNLSSSGTGGKKWKQPKKRKS